MPDFELSEQMRDGLSILIQMDDEAMASFVDSLKESLDVFNIVGLRERVEQSTRLDPQTIRLLMRPLLSCASMPPKYRARFIGDMTAAFVEEPAEEKLLQNRLEQLVGLPVLKQIGNSNRVLLENDRTFFSSSTMTEFRPVFADNPEDGIEAGVIVHTLRLTFGSSSSDEPRVFSITLDESDLNELSSTVERARSKGSALRALTKRLEIPTFMQNSD